MSTEGDHRVIVLQKKDEGTEIRDDWIFRSRTFFFTRVVFCFSTKVICPSILTVGGGNPRGKTQLSGS